MKKLTYMEDMDIFFAACKFIRAKDDFEINEENFPYTAARAFKLYTSYINFLRRQKNGRRR